MRDQPFFKTCCMRNTLRKNCGMIVKTRHYVPSCVCSFQINQILDSIISVEFKCVVVQTTRLCDRFVFYKKNTKTFMIYIRNNII